MVFVSRSYVKEKRAEKLWAIEFNNYLSDGQPKIFATLGGAQFSIYECPEMGNIKLLMRFVDPDVSWYFVSDIFFYLCADAVTVPFLFLFLLSCSQMKIFGHVVGQ